MTGTDINADTANPSRRRRRSPLRWLLSLPLLGRPGTHPDMAVVGWYDLFVRGARLIFVLLALGSFAFVVFWPTLRDDEVAFTLSYEDVIPTDDQIRMINPRYVGTDNRGRRFRVSASTGVQSSPDDPRIRLEGIVANIDLSEGQVAEATSVGGTFFVDAKALDLDGGMVLTISDGYRFATGAAQFDLARRIARSQQPLSGYSPYGTIEATGFEIRVDDRLVIFKGRLHMRIFPDGFKDGS